MIGFAPPGDYGPAFLPPAFIAQQGIDTFRFASAAYLTDAADDPADRLYTPRLLGDVVISQSGADALGVGGRIALGIADIELWHADSGLAEAARYGSTDGRGVAVRTVAVTDARASNFGTPLGSAVLAWSGIVRALTESDGQRLRLSVVDVAEKLATPLQTTRYLGTGGLEGPAALKDRPKPILVGQVWNCLPIALGNIDLGDGALPTYQTNWRSLAGHDAVRIRGVAQTLVGVAPTVGQFRDWPAVGCFQIGSTPDGAVTADARGDDDPIYVNSLGGIVRRLAQGYGAQIADAEIDSESFAFADTDIPGEMGWYSAGQEVTAGDAIAAVLAGCGAILGGGRGGTLRLFDPLARDTAQFTLAEGHIIALAPLPLPAVLRPLPRAVAVAWRRNWAPSADLAGSVADTDRAQLAAASSGPARAESTAITARVAVQREMKLPGLFYNEADAAARAAVWIEWLEAGPRVFQVTTDRCLGQIECGDIGTLTYPAHGLSAGQRVSVIGWQEALAARRLTLTLITLPEV